MDLKSLLGCNFFSQDENVEVKLSGGHSMDEII